MLRRGINLQAPWEERWLDAIAAAGFDTVPYPVVWSAVSVHAVEAAAQAALARGLAVVLDVHHFDARGVKCGAPPDVWNGMQPSFPSDHHFHRNRARLPDAPRAPRPDRRLPAERDLAWFTSQFLPLHEPSDPRGG